MIILIVIINLEVNELGLTLFLLEFDLVFFLILKIRIILILEIEGVKSQIP